MAEEISCFKPLLVAIKTISAKYDMDVPVIVITPGEIFPTIFKAKLDGPNLKFCKISEPL